MSQIGRQKNHSTLFAHDSLSMPTERELNVFRRIHVWNKTSNDATTDRSGTRRLTKAKKMLRPQSSKPVKHYSTSKIPKFRSKTTYEGSTTASASHGGAQSKFSIDPGPVVTHWYCGHCGSGPMSGKAIVQCVNCGRQKDQYAYLDALKSLHAKLAPRSMERRSRSLMGKRTSH